MKRKMRSGKLWIALAIVAALSNQCSTQAENENSSEDQEKENEITEMLNNASNWMYPPTILFELNLANSMKKFVPFSKVNKDCVEDGYQYEKGIYNQSRWAVQMYESSAKYPSNEVELGNFDQCMSASFEPLGIRSAYALIQMKFSRPEQWITDEWRIPFPTDSKEMLWALCLPDSCSEEDVERSVYRLLVPELVKKYQFVINVTVSPAAYTSASTTMPVTNAVLYACNIFILGLTLLLAGTAYDWFARPEDKTIYSRTARVFSAMRNLKSLGEDSKDNEFAVVNGLKSLALISVIVGHRIALDLGMPSFNAEYPNHIFNDFWLSFMKAPVSVEIFFVLSGFFTYLVIEKRLNDGKPLQFIHLLGYRIARILPTYITVITIFALFLPYMGDGPMWKLIVYPEAEFCQKNWWANLLFINNYVNPEEMCMVSTWYLACDMHFFIVGVILTYTIWRWKKIGFGIFGLLFALSVYVPAKYIYDNEQWGVMKYSFSTMKNLRTTEHFQKVYIKSHHRITTYLIGMAAAYVYLKMKDSKLKFSPKSRTIGFAVCVLLHSACYIVTGFFYLPDQAYNPWHHLLYFSLQRIVHSLTVSYLLVVGSLSNFGYISKFFECKLFVVIARISYVVYLVHLVVQIQSIGQIRQPFYGNFWALYWRINADLVTALCYAIPINLIVEAPSRKIFQQLKNIIIGGEREKQEPDVYHGTIGKTENTKTENLILPRFQTTI